MFEVEQVQSSLHSPLRFVVKSNKDKSKNKIKISRRVHLIDNPMPLLLRWYLKNVSRSNPIILFPDLNQEVDRTYKNSHTVYIEAGGGGEDCHLPGVVGKPYLIAPGD